jgi:hypothetical protein
LVKKLKKTIKKEKLITNKEGSHYVVLKSLVGGGGGKDKLNILLILSWQPFVILIFNLD